MDITTQHLGKVKWFGGSNSKTGRDNDYGFIVTEDKESVFVHKSSLKNCSSLNEDNLVLFNKKVEKKGLAAENVTRLISSKDESIYSDEIDHEEIEQVKSESIDPLLSYFKQTSFSNILKNHSELVDVLVNLLESNHGEDIVNRLLESIPSERTTIASLIKLCNNWDLLFNNSELGSTRFNECLETLGVELIAPEYITKNIKKLSEHLSNQTEEQRLSILKEINEKLSFSCVLYLIFSGAAPHPKHWEKEKQEYIDSWGKEKQEYSEKPSLSELLKTFIENTVTREKRIEVEDFVRDIYKEKFKNFEDYCKHSVIHPIITICFIKRKIFHKDMSFVADVRSNEILWHNPEIWFLSEVIPLIYAKNSEENIEKFILHQLWEALLSKHIDIDHPSMFKLFPQCQTLKNNYSHMSLSCEAFHWKVDEEKQIFLCRSKVCHDNKVMPDLQKTYFDFSIFDWLAHYGINYATENAPSKRDFSIKLAGYINRVRELSSKLNCRSCGTLMIPVMKYARVEIKMLDPNTQQWVIKPVNAAYRLTVFSCNSENCNEFGLKYYINHCLHYKCYELIDSRDIKEKCSEGRYICSCGACCSTHANQTDQGAATIANPSIKHREIYKDSPSFRNFQRWGK